MSKDMSFIYSNKPKITRWVFCSFSFEGMHCWPDAVHVQGVEFLALKHRHMFHVKLWLPVSHLDRDIEFIKLKRYLLQVSNDWPIDLHNASCESMAYKFALASQCFINDLTIDQMYFRFPSIRTAWDKKEEGVSLESRSKVRVEVSEDAENGAYLELDFRGT